MIKLMHKWVTDSSASLGLTIQNFILEEVKKC